MIWQDWVIAGVNIMFVGALIPSVLSKQKPSATTSMMTMCGCLAIAITYLTFAQPLYFSALVTFVMGVLWGVLWWQVDRGQFP